MDTKYKFFIMRKNISKFYDTLFVSRCIACRKRIGEANALCRSCAEKLEDEKRNECGICGKKLSECTCSNDYLRRNGVRRTIKLLHYLPDDESYVGNLLLYRLKRNYLHVIHAFLASELSHSYRSLIEPWEDTVVTYVPRTARQKRKYGFDQAMCVARALAKQLDLPLVHALSRLPSAKTQKKIHGAEARRKNVKNSFLPRKKISLRGKRVLLFDDIVTTGATVAECARALRRMGAKEVIVAAIAVTAHYTNLKYEHAKNTRLDRF